MVNLIIIILKSEKNSKLFNLEIHKNSIVFSRLWWIDCCLSKQPLVDTVSKQLCGGMERRSVPQKATLNCVPW